MDKKIENGYLDYIVKNKFEQFTIDWTYMTEASKTGIEEWIPKIKDFLASNTDFDNYNTETRDKLFNEAMDMHSSFKAAVKAAMCSMTLHGREIDFIKNRLEDDVSYDSQTVFFGIHLKGSWLNNLKFVRAEENTIEIGLTDTVVLYDLLTTTKVTGLKEKTYIFAKVLRQLAECSKIYQHFDNESDRIFKSIREWNMGLTNEDKASLAAAIVAEGADAVKA
jgi:hypothetical protein